MNKAKKKEIRYFPEEQSHKIYLLKDGKIKISRISSDGQSITLALLGSGDILGESAILGQNLQENIAEVVEDAYLCAIERNDFQELLERNNRLSRI